MSLFRKPKKMQRRVFCADDDEDDGEPQPPQPPPPPLISKEKKEAKPVKKTLLSFADEEEDGEVFKVKKSKQSSRLAKKREKEKKKPLDDGDSNKYDNNDVDMENKNKANNNADKPKKKKISLEGLILSGREALAADGTGDVSDSPPEDEDEEDNRGFHTYRAETVRAALAVAPGHIPDAALIHAARKTRQQARELGDFVPVPSEAPPGSRLVRDDDDDDEDGRIQVRGLDLPSDKPKRGTAAAPTNEELDSGPDEWEEQQIKKAMPAIMDVNAAENMEMFTMQQQQVSLPAHPHLRSLAAPGQPPLATAQQLVSALSERLLELKVDRENTAAKREELKQRLLHLSRTKESRAARCTELDAAYRHTQELRGYLTDLIECLDEKMPQLEALESQALAMHRRRCEFLMERRRADVRDQAQDVLALAARPGAAKPQDSEEKIRRAAEREGRRRARRLARTAGVSHRDGDSSDDELPPPEQHHYTHVRESILTAQKALFTDALPAWRSVRGVASRLSRWRKRAPSTYNACVAPALPRLLAPYLRHQLILWNPLADEDNEDYEKMDWYRSLMMYGVRSERVGSDSEESLSDDEQPPNVTEDSVSDDPDLMLVPTLVGKVVLPKVTELIEHTWDPVCVRACIRLRQLLIRACAVPNAHKPLQRLAQAVDARLAAALAADVFLPALPPQIMEGAGGAFWRRCLGAGVRLLRAALCLTGPPEVLHADNVVMALIERLCVAAGAAPGPSMVAACMALVETLPRTGELRALALARLAALAKLALPKLQDNPLNLRAVEQARSVIAEAKSFATE